MNALHPLGLLIRSVEDSRGWTVREIARRTSKAPSSLTHTYVSRLKNAEIRSVTYETIRALAVGLDVPERTVGMAALESMGVHDVDPTETSAAAAIARDPELDERDRRVLLAVVRELQRETDQAQSQNRPPARGGRVENPPQPDGITPSEGFVPRIREHLQRTLITEGGIPDADLLPRTQLEPVIEMYVRVALELVAGGVDEDTAFATVTTTASGDAAQALAAVLSGAPAPAPSNGEREPTKAAPGQRDFGLAADRGRSKRERMDADAARLGEGSQDPGHSEPA